MKISSDPALTTSVVLDASKAPSAKPVTEQDLEKFADPLPIPPTIAAPASKGYGKPLKISMQPATVKLHSQLPSTTVWTYNGSFPGPTIEVRSGQNVHVNWENDLSGPYPLTAVEVPLANATAGPGRDGVDPSADVAALPPWTVVHLHGARTNAWNDGWTENAILPGTVQQSEYPNGQAATTMWYHDHAMGITSLNVMTGLLGMYLIRDDEEDALDLPSGKREVPLILCDRNLDTDANGNLTGRLLHKTMVTPTGNGLPFTGPFNLVNGRIWPYLKVDACWYRFRVVNGSNFRFYTLALRDENGQPVTNAMVQIGTDGGLLGKPADVSSVTLAPAERADILIDFSAFRGQSLVLANTFGAPLPPGIPGTPNPEVMQFRVRSAKVSDGFKPPATLSKSFTRLTHDSVPEDHAHRWVALTLLNGRHPELWEMNEIDDVPPNLPVDGIVQVKLSDGTVKTLERASRSFRDAANFYVDHDGWEVWNLLNLSPVIHPIHLHLVQFQTIGLGRQRFDVSGFDTAVGGTSTPVSYIEPGTLDVPDQGWKDTIRVGQPGFAELVTIAAKFSGGTGRFMYHCHILEHEDEGMMSTFIVAPAEVMAVDPLHGPMHGGGHSHGH